MLPMFRCDVPGGIISRSLTAVRKSPCVVREMCSPMSGNGISPFGLLEKHADLAQLLA